MAATIIGLGFVPEEQGNYDGGPIADRDAARKQVSVIRQQVWVAETQLAVAKEANERLLAAIALERGEKEGAVQSLAALRESALHACVIIDDAHAMGLWNAPHTTHSDDAAE